jgi:hypothetical protein
MDLTESRAFADLLASLLRKEHHALADFLVALADFDRRRGWVELGHSSLFAFLQEQLGLSQGATFYRMKAAQLLQRFPDLVQYLRDGRICMTAMASLSKVLTRENWDEVLPRFFRLSKQEAAAVAAELCPVASPPTRTIVTTVPAKPAAFAAATTPEPGRVKSLHPGELASTDGLCAPPAAAPAPVRPVAVEPLTASQARLHMTVSPGFLAKLEAARLALSHSMPGASAEEVLTAGLDLLLQRDAKRKGLVEHPRPAPPEEDAVPGAPSISAAVRREAWKRDGGCCSWPLDGGGVCGSRLRLQLDHVVPRVEGGLPVLSNVRVLCEVHNKLAARERLGDRLMDRYCRDPRQVERGELGRSPSTSVPAAVPGPSSESGRLIRFVR